MDILTSWTSVVGIGDHPMAILTSWTSSIVAKEIVGFQRRLNLTPREPTVALANHETRRCCACVLRATPCSEGLLCEGKLWGWPRCVAVTAFPSPASWRTPLPGRPPTTGTGPAFRSRFSPWITIFIVPLLFVFFLLNGFVFLSGQSSQVIQTQNDLPKLFLPLSCLSFLSCLFLLFCLLWRVSSYQLLLLMLLCKGHKKVKLTTKKTPVYCKRWSKCYLGFVLLLWHFYWNESQSASVCACARCSYLRECGVLGWSDLTYRWWMVDQLVACPHPWAMCSVVFVNHVIMIHYQTSILLIDTQSCI